jgi:hypothetical protein
MHDTIVNRGALTVLLEMANKAPPDDTEDNTPQMALDTIISMSRTSRSRESLLF